MCNQDIPDEFKPVLGEKYTYEYRGFYVVQNPLVENYNWEIVDPKTGEVHMAARSPKMAQIIIEVKMNNNYEWSEFAPAEYR